jgi:hypothetical protein
VIKPITRTIRNSDDLKLTQALLQSRTDYPYTVTIKAGEPKRSEKQNRLMHQWFKDAQEQGDKFAEEYRAECKLEIGVPILRAENDDFCMQYDELIKHLPYEDKIALMLPPIELPVTSLMNVKQKTAFLDQVSHRFSERGMQLTDPAMLGIEDCWKRGGQ